MLKTSIKTLINISCSIVLIVSASAFWGWYSGLDFLKGISSGFVPMAPNTALLFIILSISVLSLPGKISFKNIIARTGTSIVIILSIIYLLEFSGLISSNIDFLFFDFKEGKIAGIPIGEMSFYTAVAFLLSAVSIHFLTLKSRYKFLEHVSMASAIVVISLGLFFLLGYLLGKSIIYVGSYIPMAINTAASFLFLGGGILLLTLSDEVTILKNLKELDEAVPLYKKIWGGFGLAFAAIIVISIVSFNSSIRFINTTEKIEEKHKTLNEFEISVSNIKDIALESKDFLITGSNVFIERQLRLVDSVHSRLNNLKLQLINNELARNYVDTLQMYLEEILILDKQLIAFQKEGSFQNGQEIIASENGETIMDNIRNIINKVERYEHAELEKLYRVKESNFEYTIVTFSSLIFIVLIIFSFMYFVIRKELFTRQSIEEETEMLNVKLKAVNKELEAFSYTVSHDLRAPLRHINGFLDILQQDIKEKLDEKNLRYFNLIKESAIEMGNLIEDLLTFSRTAKSGVSKSKINLNKMIDEIVEEIKQDAEKNVEWLTEELPEVNGDYSLLRIVFVNLISNAVKFTSKKNRPEITIGSLKKDNKIVIFVKDNGVGFDMKYYDKLFGVFQRLHTVSDFPGTGIGLATVKKIIEKHGGNVWANSTEGEETTFFFSLPLV